MEDCELIVLITTVACAITKCYSEDEINLLAVSFTQLGDTLSTYLVQKSLNNNKKQNDIMEDAEH